MSHVVENPNGERERERKKRGWKLCTASSRRTVQYSQFVPLVLHPGYKLRCGSSVRWWLLSRGCISFAKTKVGDGRPASQAASCSPSSPSILWKSMGVTNETDMFDSDRIIIDPGMRVRRRNVTGTQVPSHSTFWLVLLLGTLPPAILPALRGYLGQVYSASCPCTYRI